MNLNFNQAFDYSVISSGNKPLLEEGFHTVRLSTISEERQEKSGKGKGFFATFTGEHGETFDSYFCSEVFSPDDMWRVTFTSAFFSYIAKVSGVQISRLEDLLNVPFSAYIVKATTPGKTVIDPITMERRDFPAKERNDFKRGSLVEIIKAAPAPAPQNMAPQNMNTQDARQALNQFFQQGGQPQNNNVFPF